MKRLCYVFSRYSREPFDGKQNQLFKLLPLLSEGFEQIDLLGLARSKDDLQGTKWRGVSKVQISEVIFPGSYEVQSLVCLWARYAWMPWPGMSAMRRWLLDRDDEDTVFFFEGFPLAAVLGWPKRGRVFWGEVDSYLRRAHRLRRMGIRGGLNGLFGIIAARYLEKIGLATATATHVYSESDARFLRRIYDQGKVVGIPMSCNAPNPLESLKVVRTVPRVLVWADASYPYLEASVRSAFYAIGPSNKEGRVAFVFLVGNNFELSAQIASAGWEVHNRVENLAELITGVDFVLLPDLSGTGIKNRTLNALTRGICVIGTKIAWEGIPITDGEHGIILRNVSGIADQVCALFHKGENSRLARSGQELILSIFSPTVIGSQWGAFFNNSKATAPASGVARKFRWLPTR